MAAETANARAICARFLSAHLHPSPGTHASLHRSRDTLPPATPEMLEDGVGGGTPFPSNPHHRSNSATSASSSAEVPQVSAVAEQQRSGGLALAAAAEANGVRREGSIHSSQAVAGSAPSSTAGVFMCCILCVVCVHVY